MRMWPQFDVALTSISSFSKHLSVNSNVAKNGLAEWQEEGPKGMGRGQAEHFGV